MDRARTFQDEKKLSKEERQKMNKICRDRSIELKAWWFEEMINTSSPFTEQMTCFGIITLQVAFVVKSPQLMFKQNLLL